jgi:hypothetical protein
VVGDAVDRLASISVDLDTLPHYCRIFGLPEALLDEHALEVVAAKAIPRYLELFERAGTPATFFCIGSDLALPGMSAALTRAHQQGVELASHSWSHDYALSRWAPADILADLRQADDALTALTGARPVGFRAPGYTLTPALLGAVTQLGYTYDSSTYPAVPYYLAKAGVMGLLEVVRRPSRAILDTPQVLLAPTTPYRPSLTAPYARGDCAVLELPVAVAPVTRLPFIGAFATALPWLVVEATFRTMRRVPHFNFELHAIDVLDATDGVPPELVARQRDLAVSAATKLERLGRLFAWLGDDRQRVTVAEAARRYASVV